MGPPTMGQEGALGCSAVDAARAGGGAFGPCRGLGGGLCGTLGFRV